VKAYYQANKDKISKRTKAYQEANKDRLAEKRNNNKDKRALYDKQNYIKNREKLLEQQRLYRSTEEAKSNHAKWKRERRKKPTFRIKSNVGHSVHRALKNQGTTKGGSTFSALPYSPQDLVEHIEKQFDEKMNWENYGSYWHLDHIYPQSLLPYSSLEDENFQKCWALENLQPLEKIANIKKSNKILDD
tara:strand:- start:131 stop:697 length:567 start_codon:yes stop_codon:yes gene_type:complete